MRGLTGVALNLRTRFLGLLLHHQIPRMIRVSTTPPPMALPIIAQGGPLLPFELFEEVSFELLVLFELFWLLLFWLLVGLLPLLLFPDTVVVFTLK